jgi:predicted enzyme related to lactoylglutathione lyase
MGLLMHKLRFTASYYTMDHTIIHFEIPAEDLERRRKFYSDVFG